MIPLSAVLLAMAAWLIARPPLEPRTLRLVCGPQRQASRRAGRPATGTMIAMAAVSAALGCLVVLGGGVFGVGLAIACLVGVPRVAGRLEPRAARSRREQLQRQAPLVADLLATTVASGATMRAALGAVSDAVGEPSRAALRPVLAAIDLGAEPTLAWRAIDDVPHLAPVCDAVVRSARTGAPLAAVLARIAEDLRRERQATVEVAARAAGVRAVVPLAACFLPAFMLLGVVPVVASLAGQLLHA